jgi:hypothetical protein
MPADLRNRAFRSDVFLAMDVDAAGHGTACRLLRGGADARLDSLSCDLLMRRAVFPPRYVAPTRPVPNHMVLAIRWETIDAPTRAERERRRLANPPVAFPPESPAFRLWPRLSWGRGLHVRSLPAIQASYPRGAGHPDEGVVSLDLIITAGVGISACRIGFGSGNAALDDAACQVARTLDIEYASPCENCWEQRLPLQVVWRRHGSHIRLPLPRDRDSDAEMPPRDPADLRPQRRAESYHPTPLPFQIDGRDFAHVQLRAASNPTPEFDLAVSAGGRVTGCQAPHGSGDAAVDQRICALLIERGRYVPTLDIFGDPAPTTAFFYMRIAK